MKSKFEKVDNNNNNTQAHRSTGQELLTDHLDRYNGVEEKDKVTNGNNNDDDTKNEVNLTIQLKSSTRLVEVVVWAQ